MVELQGLLRRLACPLSRDRDRRPAWWLEIRSRDPGLLDLPGWLDGRPEGHQGCRLRAVVPLTQTPSLARSRCNADGHVILVIEPPLM